jgi:hypothetical protein
MERLFVSLALLLTVAAGSASAQSLCAQNRDLDSVTLRLVFTPESPGATIEYRFRFASCRVEDRNAQGDPIAPQAVRAYFDARAGYGLSVTTVSGSGRSSLVLVQQMDSSGYMIAGTLGEHATNRLSSGAIDLGPVSIADFRGPAKISHGTAVLRAERP